MAFNERWQGGLNRPPPPEGSLREGLQVHVHGLLAHGDGRRMGRMPLAPDAVGTDVEEFHARSTTPARRRLIGGGPTRQDGGERPKSHIYPSFHHLK
jgi:hypothetical protein